MRLDIDTPIHQREAHHMPKGAGRCAGLCTPRRCQAEYSKDASVTAPIWDPIWDPVCFLSGCSPVGCLRARLEREGSKRLESGLGVLRWESCPRGSGGGQLWAALSCGLAAETAAAAGGLSAGGGQLAQGPPAGAPLGRAAALQPTLCCLRMANRDWICGKRARRWFARISFANFSLVLTSALVSARAWEETGFLSLRISDLSSTTSFSRSMPESSKFLRESLNKIWWKLTWPPCASSPYCSKLR
mmetsp:Transcript_13492/g.30621  ORF Transcript_13492/g.30621 Transcript_13492/m.30621 type:complete len:245 (-) Transcript_13492:695-1429(-)